MRAWLGAMVVAYFGGWVGTQYVRVHLMSLLAPALVGVVAAWVVTALARGLPRRIGYPLAATGALLGAALGFRLVPGGQSPLHPVGTVLGPYVAAVAGVALWPLLFAVPRRQPPGGGDADAGIAL